MLEKPKYLTGEVKEFINTTFVCVKSSGYGEAFDIDRWFNINEYELKPFYNQPFDPAMIEKYFKGWRKTSLYGILENELGEIQVKKTKKKIYYRVYKLSLFEFSLPETLNHFISDCKRAGIKLEWRE